VIERINRAVADCLILCAYSRKSPHEAAAEYLASLHSDPTWDNTDVETVSSLVLGVLKKLQREGVNPEGWIK
jgi:hypothetical protein